MKRITNGCFRFLALIAAVGLFAFVTPDTSGASEHTSVALQSAHRMQSVAPQLESYHFPTAPFSHFIDTSSEESEDGESRSENGTPGCCPRVLPYPVDSSRASNAFVPSLQKLSSYLASSGERSPPQL